MAHGNSWCWESHPVVSFCAMCVMVVLGELMVLTQIQIQIQLQMQIGNFQINPAIFQNLQHHALGSVVNIFIFVPI